MHKNSVLLAVSLLTLNALIGCTSALPYNQKQIATMSPEAVAKLKDLKVFRVPLISPSDGQIVKVRRQFADIERGELAEMKARFHPTIERTTIKGVNVVVVTPQNIKPENAGKIIFYIHGGGYIMGWPTDRTGMLLTNEMGLKTYSVDYQVAPEAKFPSALNECFAVYKDLIQHYGAANIVGLSTSAGSGHMLGLLLKAQSEKVPMMRAMALWSPSVDLTDHGDSVTANDGRDLLAYYNQADKFYIAPLVGKNANLQDPLLSPIYGKYEPGFPASVIVTGTRDTFLSGSTRLYWKLRRVTSQPSFWWAKGCGTHTRTSRISRKRRRREESQRISYSPN
jgi:acetyl esterase/lipase